MFKQCSCCRHHWKDRDAFLRDPLVKLVGYQVNFNQLNSGYFMFNHMHPKCLTTLSLPVELFTDLYQGEIYRDRLTGSDKCPGFCLHTSKLQPCPAKCECGFVREVIQIILAWSKDQAA